MKDTLNESVSFKATVLAAGKTATGIQVPDEAVAQLGTSKKPAVYVTINDYAYRSTVASMGGKFMLPVSAEIRNNAGVSAGDQVEITLRLDTNPREVTVPMDLKQALEEHQQAYKFFEGLSYSNKLRIVLSVEGAKTAETRLRRIEKAVGDLAAGKV